MPRFYFMDKQKINITKNFDQLGLNERILRIISNLGLKIPTPIQAKAIPAALSGQDVIGIAQTGTGKTFAFGLPVIENLLKTSDSQAVILLPTRELAIQVEENLRKLNMIGHFPLAVLIGGENFDRQLYMIRRGPRIVVATPGRLADHLKRRTLKLDKTSILVLDEADMMLDMGFLPQVEEIMTYLPQDRQTMLFSATMPAGIVKLAAKHLKAPVRIEVAPAGTTAELVDQEIFLLGREERFPELLDLLSSYRGTVLVFVRTRHGATKLAKKLQEVGQQAGEIHSNRSLNQRRQALVDFKSGVRRILVATDVAARGLDINDIELVVNYDLPDNSEDYVHRIGRTARAGKKGKAISFAMSSQRQEIRKIETLIRKSLPVKNVQNRADRKQPEREVLVVETVAPRFNQRKTFRNFSNKPNSRSASQNPKNSPRVFRNSRGFQVVADSQEEPEARNYRARRPQRPHARYRSK